MDENSTLKKKIRAMGISLCKRFPPLRKLRYAYWGTQRKQYAALAAQTPLDAQSVVFEAFGGRQFACSPKAIYLAMCADHRFDEWSFYWSFTEAAADDARRIPELARATVVVRGSQEYFAAFARSTYWVQNNRVPEYMDPKEGQVYVQCWHGTPLKRLGFDVPETTSGGALNSARELADRFKLDASKWTYLVSPSAFTSQHLADAFGLAVARRQDLILEVGYPRNDAIVNTLRAPDASQRIAALRSRYGIPQEKKALLFAPTWRDDQYTEGLGYTLDALVDFDELHRVLGDEWVVLLRTHYYVANEFDLRPWEGFVFNVSGVGDVNDLYCIADALCTDYSSVFFDYANTSRPLFFYWPDRTHYEQDLHGFYLDADALPGPKCETAQELAQAIASIDLWYDEYGESYAAFRDTYCPLDDGHAAERVVQRVFFQ